MNACQLKDEMRSTERPPKTTAVQRCPGNIALQAATGEMANTPPRPPKASLMTALTSMVTQDLSSASAERERARQDARDNLERYRVDKMTAALNTQHTLQEQNRVQEENRERYR